MSVSSSLKRLSGFILRIPSSMNCSKASLILLILTVFCIAPIAAANESGRLVFTAAGISNWETKSFKGNTLYKVVDDNGSKVILAQSNNSASGLFNKVRLDPSRYRYLRWSWKIRHIVEKGYENSKSGDDYAARVYVVFPGRFFWQTKAINYIWANHLPKGDAIANAFTANAMMVAVESGPAKAGQWLWEERDILADYRRLFGEEPRQIGAIAIMTDTDNTATEATAWYGDISISETR